MARNRVELSNQSIYKPNCKAFTLVELLVVTAIIGILMAIAIPAIQAVRGAALRTECANNLRQIGVALQNYQSAHRHFPPGIVPETAPARRKPYSTWLTQLLPQQNIAWLLFLGRYSWVGSCRARGWGRWRGFSGGQATV